MAEYTFPASGYDSSNFLLGLLGSHWTNVYAGNNLVETYAFSRAQEDYQAHLNLLETVRMLSRFDVPIFHKDNWYFLTLKLSEMNVAPAKYDGKQNYGDGTEYGVPVNTYVYQFPTTDNLVETKLILNRVTASSRTFVSGIDFTINNGSISFIANPFEDSLLARRDVGSDTEVGLWVYRGDFDLDLIYQQFGYVLSLFLESSKSYKNLVNAIFDGLVKGTSYRELILALSAITGVPVVFDALETVKHIQKTNNELVICTDVNVYKFPINANPIVAVGDVVYAGDCLTDSLKVYDTNSGEVPTDISAISLGLGFLPGDYVEAITFVNEDKPLIVETTDGITKVSFELGGLPTDIELFWQNVHERGLAQGKTLARLLDVRGPEAATEPTAASLPDTINPMEFILGNVLRYNAVIIKISLDKINPEMALSNTLLLRKIIPPWMTIILLFELAIADDPVIMASAGTSETAGYLENVILAFGTDLLEETLDGTTDVAESVSIKLVNGICH